MKHTPGPWVAKGVSVKRGAKNICATVNAAADGELSLPHAFEVSCANARLIAAAPDLLHALMVALASLDGHAYALAVAALHKATGE
jgi:hypothetical protein